MTPTTMNPTISAITSQTMAYAPAVLAGVQAAEQSNASGATKKQAVVNAVMAGSQLLTSSPNANVAGIAALVDMFVSILNATGMFAHKTSGTAPAA